MGLISELAVAARPVRALGRKYAVIGALTLLIIPAVPLAILYASVYVVNTRGLNWCFERC